MLTTLLNINTLQMRKRIFFTKYASVLIFFSLLYMLHLNFRIFSVKKESTNLVKFINKTTPKRVQTKAISPRKIITNKLVSEQISPIISVSPTAKRKIFPFQKIIKFRSNWEVLPYSLNKNVEIFTRWKESEDIICSNKIRLYGREFLHTSHMLVNKGAAQSGNYGGEDMQDVLNQSEESEYYEYKVGFFATQCPNRPSYTFENKNHLNEWLFTILTSEPVSSNYIVREFTIAVVRYEYVNFYHSMTDWYNSFLIKEFFKMTSANTNILIIDTHPHGKLDTVWSHLFNYTRRLSKLPSTTLFTNLVWGIQGYNSPLKVSWQDYTLPLSEEFREYFLKAFNISQTRVIDCSRFNILIIWRRDYVAHPRNPKGRVERKIANEDQIIQHLKYILPSENFNIRASQIDLFDLKSQLDSVVWADIMIGMHGAGLTHAMFLNKKSALIELKPYQRGGEHFQAIAKWRKLHYQTWQNVDPTKEYDNLSTEVPPTIVSDLILNAKKHLCS